MTTKRHQDHEHGHEDAHVHHEREGWRRAWAAIKHTVTPHSHDSADRFDSAMETSKQGTRTLLWSFIALFVTALAQWGVVLMTGSVALLSDTIHNFADALTALPVGIALILGRRVATRRFTYGLGRAEDLAGLVVVLIIAMSAILAAYESIQRIIDPKPVEGLWIVAAAGVIGFVGNELVARWRIVVGRRIGSAALVADGLHARTDGFTSLGVVVGAGGVALGFPLADPVVGLAITAAILFVLRDAATEVFARLLDAVDPAIVATAEHAATDVAGVHRVGRIRMRWIGHSLRAELAVTVDTNMTLQAAHELAHRIEHHLVTTVPRLGAALVHIEPESDTENAHALLAHADH